MEVCKYKECQYYSTCDVKDMYRACNIYIQWVLKLYNELAKENKPNER